MPERAYTSYDETMKPKSKLKLCFLTEWSESQMILNDRAQEDRR